jgi:two-component system, chemotaxis family, sensor kinase CheA
MDLRRFVDLYVSETQEHIALLHRSLVALERAPDGDALSEAFRAAHTIKGLSAAMGFGVVADQAHRLEDQLAALRSGTHALEADAIDELLRAADALESAVEVAVLNPLPDHAPAEEDDTSAAAAADGPVPDGAAVVVLVTLQPDAPMKAVRGTLILRALDGMQDVLGSDPAELDDAFEGRLRIFLGPRASTADVETRIRGAGDVRDVLLQPVIAAGDLQQAVQAAAVRPRQVRVEEGRLNNVADAVAELSVLHARLLTGPVATASQAVVDRIGAVLSDLDHDMRALRMVPVRQVFDRLPRVVRDAARARGREVDLVLSGEDVELDRTILDALMDPLVHMLRNAVDHGIETPAERAASGKPERGSIHVSAERERGSVRVVVADDGRGVSRARVADRARAAGLHADDELDDAAIFALMSQPGFSTADGVTETSGRGVGMDVVVSCIRSLGGAIDMHTRDGEGTTFTMRLPISLALAQALRVRIGGEDYAIPLTHIAEAIELDDAAAGVVSVRARPVRVVRLRRVLQVETEGSERAAVIAGIGDRRAALAVDELVGREQIVVRSFDAATGMLPYFSGATLLADGRPALVLDPLSLL